MDKAKLIEFATSLGLKKALAIFLKNFNLIDKDSAGQVVLHINNGGVTKICFDNWKVE